MEENTNKYGLVSWDDVEFPPKNNGKSFQKDEYMKLQNGDNFMRIVTKPAQYKVHTWKTSPNAPGFGDKVYCSFDLHGKCACCETMVEIEKKDGKKIKVPNQPKKRWWIGVIDRRDQRYKLIDISENVFKMIQDYSREEDYGAPERYDINIKMDKNAPPAKYYTVLAKVPKPMSPADLEIKAGADLERLAAKCTPPTPEQVVARMNALRAKKGVQVDQSTEAEEHVASESSEDDDKPVMFKDADAE